MTIHVVQPEETLDSIAAQYGVTAERLILENGIINPNLLAVGQTIVIVEPMISYTVQEGDTLFGIAEKNQVSIIEIYRNNPYLADRDYILPGETIVIKYDTWKLGPITTNGFAYSFIDREIFRKTLPFLTFFTTFNYRQTATGEIIDVDDQELIDMAKKYGVAPLMLVSTQTIQGGSSCEIATTLLNSPEIQDNLIDNIIEVLKRKGYYGLNQYFQFYTTENEELYVNYVQKLRSRLNREGFKLIITITPSETIEQIGCSSEVVDYSAIAQYSDALTLLSYNWGFSYGPPASATPVNLLRNDIENLISTVPANKVVLGLPVIGYDWTLPYIPGYTKANAVTPDMAVQNAAVNKVDIRYSEIAQGAYFFYTIFGQLHNVWFKDARSIEALATLVTQYGLSGLSIWNIMFFYTQMWFVINNMYEIERLEDFNPIS